MTGTRYLLPPVDQREFNAILAGVRALEALKRGTGSDEFEDIESDGDVEPLTVDELDELAVRLNTDTDTEEVDTEG